MDNKAFYSAFNRSADLLQMSARNFAGNMEDARELYQETAFQISRTKKKCRGFYWFPGMGDRYDAQHFYH